MRNSLFSKYLRHILNNCYDANFVHLNIKERTIQNVHFVLARRAPRGRRNWHESVERSDRATRARSAGTSEGVSTAVLIIQNGHSFV